ncbi:tRNA (guanine(37)-N1)-methyltransferase [Photinus pyralis]|uniref:tRNA (guanine(37)-N1)-methyltransferase n=1 Tax=Photinus pyralis TaxID=7054 RepID=A0A1Y1KV63_PHOPY|nr:tRNA (guanine(37)-N1)-methyltransferase [Photinus pyralis]
MKIFSIFRWYFNLHLKNTMPTTNSGVNLPKCVRNMTILDKSKFDTDITVPIIHLRQAHVSDVMPYLKKYGLRIRHLKPLQTCTDNNQKYMLLNRNIQTYSAMDECDREGLKKHSITEENFDTVNLRLTYDNFHADEIFRAILPENQDGFSSFSQVGHIIHLNLREHLLPFKSIIGEVLLEKTPRTRTVVNKVDMIENTYRNFQMEIICGDPDMTVQLKENRCQFEFDFSQVYWNPRLSTEHERIVDSLSKDDVVFDVFAGVGPFSIPAAKKGCIVYANDLNPESYKWLLHNARKNKVNLSAYNKDGRDFIREDLKDQLIKYVNKQNITIIMNLPALAVEFLGGFLKLYDGNEIGDLHKPPILHVYCFTKGEDVTGIAKKLITEQFKFDVEDKILNIFRVRTVSNFKEMVRVTIKLDKEILTNENVKRSCSPSLDNASKKSRHGKEEQNETNKECD